MARDTSPIVKQSRREGVALHPKAHKVLARKSGIPGQHGQGRQGKQSMYATQLREKQKVRRMYGLLEKQFAKLMNEATRKPGLSGENLLQMLELRLDNTVYRAGFATSRRGARQLVSHGHFELNGRRVDIPSYLVSPGDVIEVREGSRNSVMFKRLLGEDAIFITAPQWLAREKNTLKGTVTKLPTREDIDFPVEEHLIVELYSK